MCNALFRFTGAVSDRRPIRSVNGHTDGVTNTLSKNDLLMAEHSSHARPGRNCAGKEGSGYRRIGSGCYRLAFGRGSSGLGRVGTSGDRRIANDTGIINLSVLCATAGRSAEQKCAQCHTACQSGHASHAGSCVDCFHSYDHTFHDLRAMRPVPKCLGVRHLGHRVTNDLGMLHSLPRTRTDPIDPACDRSYCRRDGNRRNKYTCL